MKYACSTCGVEKVLLDYHKDNRTVTGHTASCKPCRNSKTATWQANRKMLDKEKYSRHRKSLNYKSKYGITLEEYEQLVETQQQKCIICLQCVPLVVDHCHTTGTVRQLLCTTCNTGLGSFKENIFFLESAISYIMQHSVRETS